LPGLGAAFRSNTKSRLKQNLIIFVTPTIVTEQDFAPTDTEYFKKKSPTDRPESDQMGFDAPMESTHPYDWSKPVY
jgi:type II secretory pathway component GspD/PulD (secretin)